MVGQGGSVDLEAERERTVDGGDLALDVVGFEAVVDDELRGLARRTDRTDAGALDRPS